MSLEKGEELRAALERFEALTLEARLAEAHRRHLFELELRHRGPGLASRLGAGLARLARALARALAPRRRHASQRPRRGSGRMAARI